MQIIQTHLNEIKDKFSKGILNMSLNEITIGETIFGDMYRLKGWAECLNWIEEHE